MKKSSWVIGKRHGFNVWTATASVAIMIATGLLGAEKKSSIPPSVQPIRTLTSPWLTNSSREVMSIHPIPHTEDLLVLSFCHRPSIQIIDGNTLSERVAIPIPDTIEYIHSLTSYSDEKRFLAVVCSPDEGGAKLMELTVPDGTFKLVRKLKDDIRAVDLHAGKQFVACEGNRAFVYDRRTHLQVAALERPLDGKSDVEIHARRRIENGESLTRGILRELAITGIYGCKDGTRCITNHYLGALECWDVTTGQRLWRKGGENDPHYLFDRNPVDDSVLVTHKGGDLVRIESGTGKEMWRIELTAAVECARWAPDGRSIATVDEGRLYLISGDGKQRVSTPIRESRDLFLEWSANGDRIYLVIDGLIAPYDRNLKPLHPNVEVKPFDHEIKGMAVVGNGNILIFTETQIGYFKRNEHRLTRVWGHEAQDIDKLAVSPNGKFVAIHETLNEDENQLAILECETGKPIQRIGVLEGDVLDVVFGPQNRYLYLTRQRMHEYGAENGMVIDRLNIMTGVTVSQLDHPSNNTTEAQSEALERDGGFDLGSEEDLGYYEAHTFSRLAVEPNGNVMTAVADNEHIVIWALDQKQFSKVLHPTLNGTVATFLRRGKSSRHLAILNSEYPGTLILSINEYGVTEPEPLTPTLLTKTIEQLGDSRYKTRETATRRLVKGGLNAVFGLPKLPSSDPEVQARVERVQSEVLKKVAVAKETNYALEMYDKIIPVPHKQCLWMALRSIPFDKTIFELAELKGGKIRVLKRLQNLANDCRKLPFFCFGPDNLFYTCNSNGSISVYDLDIHVPKKTDALRITTSDKRSEETPRKDAEISKSVTISVP